MTPSARQQAFLALRSITYQDAFADIALDRVLRSAQMERLDRSLTTELVYGCTRRRRTLDALIDQFATKSAAQQPPDLRIILHLGLYQLRYLTQIPPSAAVTTTVDLAKQNRLGALSGFVNGVLRQYLRQAAEADPLRLPNEPIDRLAIQYSYPDWLTQLWINQFGLEVAETLCDWFNQPPSIDLRVNPLATSIDRLEAEFAAAKVRTVRLPYLPQALRLQARTGAIDALPGFAQGWWTVQDASAQLVGHLLNPQPGEVVIDACAAPGGKTTHLAELMQDQGKIWAIDRAASRLKKVQQNADRLKLRSIETLTADSRDLPQFHKTADRVLLDAPCSGLGTLHRHADARWRQTPDSIAQLVQLQTELLAQAATWVKPGGVLVYATCTLNQQENEAIVQQFLADHPDWQIQPPDSEWAEFATSEGWLKIRPDQQQMDGFFMTKLQLREE
ncbi:16S rRNA (cytosine(967)-C(5))-methyltransferase [Microcoleus sp. FACHB-1515]|uniref:16S rRNA (cytosine(967)-C(5))-methyltransferase n=1 Tax=Cyanophyceae TaxID=3028117 RepID=UPI0016835E50|nr:16S rRNA (cytosine(967)-C(5))-methyltransferase [Microcoleus sp. FACHB-1515]MBD2089595.1 16S rRNA (cytosine(967)-C(5))-methyltransferase [Microcoleus sp. FACHB-1515]